MSPNRVELSKVLLVIVLALQFVPLGNIETVHASDQRSANSTASTIVFDFTKEICNARWQSGAGTALPCPLTDGDSRGFALAVGSPSLENGL
jgi:hypothetical protein